METSGLLLEGRVRDLVSTADRQLASKSYDAAIDTYRTALAGLSADGAVAERNCIGARLVAGLLCRARYHQAAGRFSQAFASAVEALSLEPANPAAVQLREQLIEAMPELAPALAAPTAGAAPPAPVEESPAIGDAKAAAPDSPVPREPESRFAEPDVRPIEAPSFHLLDSDTPLLETAHHEEYQPEPEVVSILNPAPPVETPDYSRIALMVFAIAAVCGAIAVISNSSGRHVSQDALRVNVAPPPAASATDDQVYRVGGAVTPPILRSKVEPEYTAEARRARIQGTVLLALQVDSSGTPVNLRVLRGLDMGLNERAIEAVRKWRFQPGMKDGKPVTVAAQVEVNFRLL